MVRRRRWVCRGAGLLPLCRLPVCLFFDFLLPEQQIGHRGSKVVSCVSFLSSLLLPTAAFNLLCQVPILASFFSFSLILKLTLRPAKGRKRAKKESGRGRKGGGQCRQVALGANARRIKGVDRVWKGTTVGEAESGKSDRERCGRRKGAKARCRRGDKCDLLIGKPQV